MYEMEAAITQGHWCQKRVEILSLRVVLMDELGCSKQPHVLRVEIDICTRDNILSLLVDIISDQNYHILGQPLATETGVVALEQFDWSINNTRKVTKSPRNNI